jgi:hypothetical protein
MLLACGISGDAVRASLHDAILQIRHSLQLVVKREPAEDEDDANHETHERAAPGVRIMMSV